MKIVQKTKYKSIMQWLPQMFWLAHWCTSMTQSKSIMDYEERDK